MDIPLLPTLGFIVFIGVMLYRYCFSMILYLQLIAYEATRRVEEPSFSDVWKSLHGKPVESRTPRAPGNVIFYFILALLVWPVYYAFRRRWRFLLLTSLIIFIHPLICWCIFTSVALYAQFRQVKGLTYHF